MRVPRTAATLQLVSETGCPTRNQKKIFPHQHLKVAWPLVLLDVSPPRTGRALTYGLEAWPRLVVRGRTHIVLCGLSLNLAQPVTRSRTTTHQNWLK